MTARSCIISLRGLSAKPARSRARQPGAAKGPGSSTNPARAAIDSHELQNHSQESTSETARSHTRGQEPHSCAPRST